ncbi:DUF2530 domain-containing protein [Amycolatopsis anabasis]|uniref:DUF2530 domain-containing protein n=1 Tax=Amycolatopsis anabasis TaxID=1840409 RepID=UPI003CCE0E00
MAEAINDQDVTGSLRPPPELPKQLTALFPVVVVGTVLWLIGFAILFVAYLGSDGPPGVWLWTTVAGAALGFIGMPIMLWQRAAARRGSKTAQTGL